VDADLWAARGVIDALTVPFLAVATRAQSHAGARRHGVARVVFHSAAMLGAAAYLLLMALAGYYIRYFGGTWGSVLQVTFLFGAAMLLVAIMFSGTLPAHLRVFVAKNFFSYRYDYREEWLASPARCRKASRNGPARALHPGDCRAGGQSGGALWLAPEAGAFERVAHWNMPAAGGSVPAGALLPDSWRAASG